MTRELANVKNVRVGDANILYLGTQRFPSSEHYSRRAVQQEKKLKQVASVVAGVVCLLAIITLPFAFK